MESENTKDDKKSLKMENKNLLALIGTSMLNIGGAYLNLGKIPTMQEAEPKIKDAKLSIPIKDKSTRKIIEEVLILPPGYSQIESSATQKETLDFLRNLANYMEETEFTDFLLQVFKVFNRQPKGKYFSLNLTKRQKGKMRCLIAQFRIKYGSKTIDESKTYALLLINNFELFKNDKLSSLINNMKPSKWPIEKNRIPTSQKK